MLIPPDCSRNANWVSMFHTIPDTSKPQQRQAKISANISHRASPATPALRRVPDARYDVRDRRQLVRLSASRAGIPREALPGRNAGTHLKTQHSVRDKR